LLDFHLLIYVYLPYLCLYDATEKLGEFWRLWQASFEDPLLDAVDVLESNWKLAQDILQQTRHVMIRMFIGFCPKKKDEMRADNLQKLIAAFDTIEDPIRAMKRISVKRGVEGAIALAQSHGEEVNWEKVGASYGIPLVEMTEFFKKAKEYAPKLVSLILPPTASSTTAPRSLTSSSSTPVVDASVHSSATDPTTEVA
jgi:hypothetical protein